MKTIDLKRGPLSLEQVLSIAANEAILLVADDGRSFILEEAHDFEREVSALADSESFMSFLEARMKEPATVPLDDLLRELNGAGGMGPS